MKQNCDFFQMYLCRIRFRETIPKISLNMSTICINYQLKTLRESLTRVTNDFLGPEDSDRSGGRWGPLLFGNEVRNIL